MEQQKGPSEEETQLRADIANLEALAHMAGTSVLLEAAKAELQEKVLAKRAAKPVDWQIQDLQGLLERRQKALGKQEGHRATLLEQLAGVQQELHGAAHREAELKDEITGLQEQREALYRKKVPGATRVAQGQEAGAGHSLQLQGLWTTLVQALPKAEHLGAYAREAVQKLQDAFENKPDPELLPDAEGGPEEQRMRQAEVQ